MEPKLIKTALYSLVGANFLTLVLGLFSTWLGYTIPVKLRAFGLAPEVAKVAGLASFLLACLGLCALNYSSHFALNVYGVSCAIFVVLMLCGVVPERWRHHSARPLAQTGPAATNHTPSSNLIGSGTGSGSGLAPQDNLGFDLFCCVVLLTFASLVVFAFVFANYLRRAERAELARRVAEATGHANGGPCDLGGCTCGRPEGASSVAAAAAAAATSNILGSLPNLAQPPDEELLAHKYNSLSQAVGRSLRQPLSAAGADWPPAPQQQQLQQQQQRRRRRQWFEADEGRRCDYERASPTLLRDSTGGQLGASGALSGTLPPLVHRGLYYAANARDECADRQQAARFRDPASYPQVNNSYRHTQRAMEAAAAGCRCGSSGALAARLQSARLPPLHYRQPAVGLPKWPPYERRQQQQPPASCPEGGHKRSKPSGGSVMAITAAAAAAALFGAAVEAPDPLDSSAHAAGFTESANDDFGLQADRMDDYAHQQALQELRYEQSAPAHDHQAALQRAPLWDYGQLAQRH